MKKKSIAGNNKILYFYGLKETDSKATKSLMMGVMYTGIFRKTD
jgi:hypothetical protein